MATTYDAPSNTITVSDDPVSFTDINTDVGAPGVWEMLGANQFLSGAFLVIASGGHVEDVGNSLYFSNGIAAQNGDDIIRIQNGGKMTLGNLLDAGRKSSDQGCLIGLLETTFNRPHIICDAGSEVYLYSSTIMGFRATFSGQLYNPREGRIWNCTFDRYALKPLATLADGVDVFNCNFYNPGVPLFGPTRTVINKVNCFDVTNIAYYTSNVEAEVSNIYSRGETDLFRTGANFDSCGFSFIDCDPDSWSIGWNAGSTGLAYRKYTVNIELLDKDNNAIQATGAVRLLDVDGNTTGGFTWVDTDANGQITEQTAIRGYCDKNNSDLDSDLTKDYSASPGHKLEVKVSGYKSYECQFTLDEPIDWRIRMEKVLDMNLSKRVGVFSQ